MHKVTNTEKVTKITKGKVDNGIKSVDAVDEPFTGTVTDDDENGETVTELVDPASEQRCFSVESRGDVRSPCGCNEGSLSAI